MVGERSQRVLLDETRSHLRAAVEGLGELQAVLDQVVQAQEGLVESIQRGKR